jgi:hypothetical protein
MNYPGELSTVRSLASGIRAEAKSSPFQAAREGLVAKGAFPGLMVLILGVGACLRLFLPFGFINRGVDEGLYATYISLLDQVGLKNYSILIQSFLSHQLNPLHEAILPPTRLVYISGGYFYHHVFGLTPVRALQTLSCHFSILTLLIASAFCWRLTRQRAFTAALTVLMACAPTQIHLGQHALIDGVFGFWALLVVWLLWENLQTPDNIKLLAGYCAALVLLVMTKESAFFIFAAITGIFVANRWLQFGRITRLLLLTTFLSGCIGLAVVVLAAGGIECFTLVFILLKEKVPLLPYAMQTGGGPWHRYLVDLILVSPIITILAIVNLLQGRSLLMPGRGYLATFSCVVYAVLTGFPDGMNLRYILILDMPLRFLAATQLFAFSSHWGRHKGVWLTLAVLALCTYELREHNVLFVKGKLYELVTEDLIRAQGILK